MIFPLRAKISCSMVPRFLSESARLCTALGECALALAAPRLCEFEPPRLLLGRGEPASCWPPRPLLCLGVQECVGVRECCWKDPSFQAMTVERWEAQSSAMSLALKQ